MSTLVVISPGVGLAEGVLELLGAVVTQGANM
jgi:hypothetical protein